MLLYKCNTDGCNNTVSISGADLDIIPLRLIQEGWDQIIPNTCNIYFCPECMKKATVEVAHVEEVKIPQPSDWQKAGQEMLELKQENRQLKAELERLSKVAEVVRHAEQDILTMQSQRDDAREQLLKWRQRAIEAETFMYRLIKMAKLIVKSFSKWERRRDENN